MLFCDVLAQSYNTRYEVSNAGTLCMVHSTYGLPLHSSWSTHSVMLVFFIKSGEFLLYAF